MFAGLFQYIQMLFVLNYYIKKTFAVIIPMIFLNLISHPILIAIYG